MRTRSISGWALRYSLMVLQAMAAALSSGKWYTPVLIDGKSTVLQPFSDARVRQER